MVEKRMDAQGVSSPAAAPQPEEPAAREEQTGLRRALGIIARHAQRPVTIGALFTVAFGVLAFQYFQVSQSARRLESRINSSRALAALPVPEKQSVAAEIAAWQAARDAAVSLRIDEAPHTDLVTQVLAAARAAGVEVLSAGVVPGTVVHLPPGDFVSTTLVVRAAGPLPALRTFISRLENTQFDTIEVKNASIILNEDSYLLNLQASIYSEPEYGGVRVASGDAAAKAVSSKAGQGGEGGR
jgi:hypothetical protein